jgi:hypothetical protein
MNTGLEVKSMGNLPPPLIGSGPQPTPLTLSMCRAAWLPGRGRSLMRARVALQFREGERVVRVAHAVVFIVFAGGGGYMHASASHTCVRGRDPLAFPGAMRAWCKPFSSPWVLCVQAGHCC